MVLGMLRLFPVTVLFLGCPQNGDNGTSTETGGAPSDGGLPSAECVSDSECEVGFICVAQTCIVEDDAPDGGLANAFEDAGVLVADAGPEAPPQAPWLLSVNNNADTLIKINTETGEMATVCSFTAGEANYPSTTFGLNGTLYGWNGANKSLDVIDPCTCAVTQMGLTVDDQGVAYTNIPGITADGNKIETLFGLSTDQDKLLELGVANGLVRPIGDLGLDFHYSGTSWSTELEGLYAINDLTDELYVLNADTGLATSVADLDIDVNLVGIEYHIDANTLYLCTNAGFSTYSSVYSIDVTTGATTMIKDLGYSCNNLAAPWTTVSCVDAVAYPANEYPEH